MHPTAVVPRPKPPTTTVRMPLLTAPPLRGSPSCVSGVGTSFVDEVPRIRLITPPTVPIPTLPPSVWPGESGGREVKREIWEETEEAWDNRTSWELNGTHPVWEEPLEEDNKAILHQGHFLGWSPEGFCLRTLLSPPKTEPPPSVAFVGPEPGTQQFVDAPHQYHHLHHHFSGSDQQHQFNDCHHLADYGMGGGGGNSRTSRRGRDEEEDEEEETGSRFDENGSVVGADEVDEEWDEVEMDIHYTKLYDSSPLSGSDQQHQFNDCHHLADYGWVGVEEQPYLPMDAHNAIVFGTAGPASSSSPSFQQNTIAVAGHHEQYLPIGQEHEEFQITDISSSTPFQYGPAVFDPLSVGTSASWSAGEGGHSSAEEALEYSSLSQDEILEEIQRECAEIECRSSSDSLPQQAKSSKKGNNKRAVAVKRTPSTVMKKKPYSGRGSVSSLDSPEVSPAPTARRRERKKELNRVAATRYREKKRKEREQTSGDLQELEQRNAQLKADIAAVQAEMNYLKGLAAEIETARRQGKRR
uniref:BZIP domain-containing protein n=1 Tax=Globodera pallida TaxID=36090 RepID=A0A183BL26_GLOPA